MSYSAILSLAILKVNYDDKKEYLDTFLPIVAECIRCAESDIISVQDLQESLKHDFSLNIPQHVIKSVLNKAVRAKYVVRDRKVLKRNSVELEKLNFKAVKIDMLRKQSELINHLIKFVEEKFGVEWTEDEAEVNLIRFIQNNQIMSFKKGVIYENKDIEVVSGNKEKLYIAKFIDCINNSNSHIFYYLEDVLKGLVISSVVYVNEPSEVKMNFKNMKVYLDTSLIIFILGYAGENNKAQALELLKLLQENNILVRCFRHNINEAIGALNACAHKIEKNQLSDGYGPSLDYFISNGKTMSDIKVMINNMDSNLNNLNIHIEDIPDYNNMCYIDEEGLKIELTNKIQYRNEDAIDNDIMSISAITRLRKGKKYNKIEECKAIFVTNNNTLVKVVSNYLNIAEEFAGMMPAISDYALTILLWLKKPLSAQDLPRKQIIAECYAACQPSEALWRKYEQEIDKLTARGDISADESVYLKWEPVVRDILMDVTHGDDICDGTVQEIMERARNVIRMEQAEVYENSINDVQKNLDIQREEVMKRDNIIEDKNLSIKRFAKKSANRVELLVKWGLYIFYAIIEIASILSSIPKKFKFLITVIVVIVGIYSMSGGNVPKLAKRLADKRYNKIIRDMDSSNLEIAMDKAEELNL